MNVSSIAHWASDHASRYVPLVNSTISHGYDSLDKLATNLPLYMFVLPINPEWQSSGFILIISLITVFVGSYSTISKPKYAVLPNKNDKNFDASDNDYCKYYILSKEQVELQDMNKLNWGHTISIPILSGMTLYGLNYLITNWSREKLNFYLNVYFTLASPVMVANCVNYLLVVTGRKLKLDWSRFRLILVKDNSLPLGMIDSNLDHKKVHDQFPDYVNIITPTNAIDPPLFNYVFDLKPLVTIPVTLFIVGLFYSYNPTFSDRSTNWIVSNMVAFCFTVSGINQLQFGRFKLLVVLLTALFVYDIYFVFGTEIMLTVATGLNIPIKFLFPKNLSTPQTYILIGLGDLVIPGVFLSLCLRFDHYNYYIKNKVPFHHLNIVPKPYFTSGFISYCGGLVLTSIVLHISKSGQPALLYIVPLLFIGVAYQAWKRDEFAELWKFNDDLEKKSDKEAEVETAGDDEEDEDYEQECYDSYDEWEDRVELKRQQLDQDTDEDKDIIYQFLSSDDDDDTFIIGEDDEEEDDDDEDEVIIEEEIIQTLRQDLSKPVQEWYDEES